MENFFLLNSLAVLSIDIFKKYGPNTLNGQRHIQILLSRRRGGMSSKVLPPVPCFISTYRLIPSVSPASLAPCLLKLPPAALSSPATRPLFFLGSQPHVLHHLLILLVLQNTRHKYDNNIFHHLLLSSSCCLYIDLHSLQEPCMHIALQSGELNTRLHIVDLS